MTIPEFIEKAIEGGYDARHFIKFHNNLQKSVCNSLFLEAEAWKAVGKVEGWNKEVGEGNCNVCGEPMPEGETMFMFHGYSGGCPKPPITRREWKGEMHRMVEALAEGKTIEEYLDTL